MRVRSDTIRRHAPDLAGPLWPGAWHSRRNRRIRAITLSGWIDAGGVEDSSANRHGPLALRCQARHADATHVRLGEFAVRGLVSRWRRRGLCSHPERYPGAAVPEAD